MILLWLDWLLHAFFFAYRERKIDRWGEELARWHSCSTKG